MYTNLPDYKTQNSIIYFQKKLSEHYLYNTSWVFGFSYMLYLSENLQLC